MEYLMKMQDAALMRGGSSDSLVIPALMMCALIAVVIGVMWGVVKITMLMSPMAAVSPEEFNQEFFSWSYINLEHRQGIEFSCYHAGGVVGADGNCHDSRSVRHP